MYFLYCYFHEMIVKNLIYILGFELYFNLQTLGGGIHRFIISDLHVMFSEKYCNVTIYCLL